MDFIECSPNIYCHITSLMFFRGILDFSVVTHRHHSILTHAASRRLAFGFENSILMTIVLIIFIKYVMLSMRLQTKDTWDNKAIYKFYTGSIYRLHQGLAVHCLHGHHDHILPRFAIWPMYLAIRWLNKAVEDTVMSC